MPKGFRTEEGPRPDLRACFGLLEAETARYAERTRRNVLLADGTVVFGAAGSPGSMLTMRLCYEHRKSCLELPLMSLAAQEAAETLRRWLAEHAVRVLNVTGSRESGALGIGAHVTHVLERAPSEEPQRGSQ